MKRLSESSRYLHAMRSRKEMRRRSKERHPAQRARLLSSVAFRGNLDLRTRTGTTRRQLKLLTRQLELLATRPAQPRRLHLSFRDVHSICPGSLLYLLACIHELRHLWWLKIRCDYPRDKTVDQLMTDVGFWKDLGIPERVARSGTEHAAVRRGSRNHGWQEIKNFLVTRCRPRLTTEQGDKFYLALGECAENVLSHAYGPEIPASRRVWHAVGVSDPHRRRATVAIVDLGVGIHATLKRNVSLWGVPKDVVRTHAQWLELSTTGRRTRSQHPKHGKGLRSLREFACAAPGRRLFIMSGGASITVTHTGPQPKRHHNSLPGTVVCLEVTS